MILATNVAETSLTVEGVTDVIDTGLHKVLRYDAVAGPRPARARAHPRRLGRAARGPGGTHRPRAASLRLWDARDRLRPRREPEIERVDLAGPLARGAGLGRRPGRLRVVRGAAAPSGWRRRCACSSGWGRSTAAVSRRTARRCTGCRCTRASRACCSRPEAGRGRRPSCAVLGEGWRPAVVRGPADDRLRRAVGGRPDARGAARRARGRARAGEAEHPEALQSAGAEGSAMPADSSDACHGVPRNDRRRRLLRALLAGFPDRVARRREPGSSRLVLASGTGRAPRAGERRAGGRAACRARGGRRRGRGRRRRRSCGSRAGSSASGSRACGPRSSTASTRPPASVRAFAQDWYDALLLGERAVPPDPAAAAPLLAEALERRGLGRGAERLATAPACGGARGRPARGRARGVRGPDEPAVARRAGAVARRRDTRARLDRLAPERLALPSGRTTALDYREDGSIVAAVKLQELFGLAETPRIGPRAGAGRLRAAGPERPAGADDARPAQLLGADVPRGPQGAARALPEAPLARGPLDRRADAPDDEEAPLTEPSSRPVGIGDILRDRRSIHKATRNMSNDLVIGMAGSGGDGIVSAGEAMITAAALEGYHAILTKSFGSQIRGGESSCRVRLSTRPGPEPGRHARRGRGPQLGRLPEVRRRAAGGRAHDRRLRERDGRRPGPAAAARASRRGRRSRCRSPRWRRSTPAPRRPRTPSCSACFAGWFGRGPRVAPRRDPEEVRQEGRRGRCRATRAPSPPGVAVRRRAPAARAADALAAAAAAMTEGKLLVDGNEMCAAAAIFAGCEFFGGYPITPSSEIMQFLGREIWKYGGDDAPGRGRDRRHRRGGGRVVRRQEGDDRDLRPGHVAQDRDAGPGHRSPSCRSSASTCSAAGRPPASRRRASSPTSSRPASPRTATWCARCWRRPRVADTFGITVEAFNIAEQYQTPVIILSDQEIAQRKETVDPIDTKAFTHRRAPAADRGGAREVRALPATDSGISPISHPGMRGRQLPGLRHRAQRARRPDRERRGPRADEREAHPQARPAEAPPRPVRARGRSARAAGARGLGQRRRRGARGARDRRGARASRSSCSCRSCSSRWPRRSTPDFFRGVQAGLVVEQSHQGQLYRILRMYVDVPAGVQSLARSGSNPILPTSIVERLRQDRPRPAAAAGGRGGAGGLARRARREAA